jgi:putative transposase
MSYTDLLKGRYSQPGGVYFVTGVTHMRQPVFYDMYCARDLANCFRCIHDSDKVASLAWVIMPDHFHWLLQLSDGSLSGIMRELKGISARKINQRLCRRGKLWQQSYFDRAIRDSEDIREVARYIVANPLRAGIVENIGEYPHWDAIWL